MTRFVKSTCITIAIVSIMASGGCKQEQFAAPPYIPAEYFACIETYPEELVHAYFAGYGEISGPRAMYDNKVFVFKDTLVDAWVLREVDKGWLWLDLIKCTIVNTDYMNGLKMGDKFDLVGLNLGPEDITTPGLTFKDCYIFPCGSVNIPAGGSGGAVGPAY